jgi:hypothetical protein
VLQSGAAATRAPFAAITLDGTSNVLSLLTDPKCRGKGSTSRSSGDSSKENKITVPSKTSKYISKTTRRTPQQVPKANMEITEMKEMKALDLKLLFDKWRVIEVPDIQLPLQPQDPLIQSVSHTALGRVVNQKFEEALAAGGDAH